MNKKLLLTLVFLGLSVAHLQASVSPPRGSDGKTLPTVDWVGAIPCSVDSSTGTNAVLCASGRAVVYGVIISSVANTHYMVLRDSATANTTSSTATIVFANGSNANSTGEASQMFRFTVPIRFTNGISVNLSNTPTTGNGPRWTILYRPLTATE